MELLNEAKRHHVPEDIIWSIGEWSDDEGRLIEENRVGYQEKRTGRSGRSLSRGQVCISSIPDGEYPLVHWAYAYSTTKEAADKWTSKKKIRVQDGAVDIQSVKVAVAEILNQCGGWHVFVERLLFEKDGKVSAFLGS
tara:strand:- start:1689 stop:2102 length:414 start_codon:yes stop_codon:yes gene_type:complete